MADTAQALATLRTLYDSGVFSSSFYRDRVTREQLENYAHFQTIPFTRKEDIRATSAWERTVARPGEVYGVFSSSGTTGDKTFYVYSMLDKRVHEDVVHTYLGTLGVNATDIGAVLAPVGTDVMSHTMMWEFTTMGAGYVNCPEPTVENIVHTIERVPVTIIATRPSIASSVAANPVARQVARNSSVRMLALGGGFLSRTRRALIEDAWDAPCYNLFGMSEVFGPMAAECPQKSGLHYRDDLLLIEVVDPVTCQPVEPGMTGVAVYTTLWAKGFPLLRYWTRDLVRIVQDPCACGSPLPRFKFAGRLDDCFRLDGRYVFPEQIEDILYDAGARGEFQALRGKRGVIVSVEDTKLDLATARERLEELIELPVRIKIVAGDTLPHDGHGRRLHEEQEA